MSVSPRGPGAIACDEPHVSVTVKRFHEIGREKEDVRSRDQTRSGLAKLAQLAKNIVPS